MSHGNAVKVWDMRKAGTGPRTNGRQVMDLLLVGVAALLLAACSIKRTAVNIVGDALAGGGGVYASDSRAMSFKIQHIARLPFTPHFCFVDWHSLCSGQSP